ncbi:MAG: uroporphyrinogen decarboxylase family protein [Melioribacteraceae bacterium]|nr:uroporphyrinogen decarboxylase family protein [Melioribacteraceae bacterium]
MLNISELTKRYFDNGKRIVAPLVGFPGVKLSNSTIKIAQQNYVEHFKVIRNIYNRFQPDIIFPLMDLSVEANAIGRNTIFPINESATVIIEKFELDELENLKQIEITADSRIQSYTKTISLMKNNLPDYVVIGGYVIGPYTFAGLILGADNAALKSLIAQDELITICEFTCEVILKYVELQILSGVDVICILEPSAVMLGPKEFKLFSSNFVKKISEFCKNKNIATIYHICGNSNHLIYEMCNSGVEALSLDSKNVGIDLSKVAKNIPQNIVLIGNVNPTGAILNGSPNDVEYEIKTLLNVMKDYPNFILSTGCDLPIDVPLENIDTFMKVGKNYNWKNFH